MSQCLRCFQFGTNNSHEICSCQYSCSKVFTRGNVRFELNDNAYEILTYHLEQEAKKKNKKHHYVMKDGELQFHEHDVSVQLLNYVTYIQENGVLKETSIFLSQEQYGREVLLFMHDGREESNDLVKNYYEKLSNVEIETMAYLRERFRTKRLISVHGDVDEAVLKKLEHGEMQALEDLIKSKKWAIFYFKFTPEQQEEIRQPIKSVIERIEVMANRKNLEICLVHYYGEACKILHLPTEEKLNEKVAPTEKRKMKIDDVILPLYEPILKTKLEEKNGKYRFTEKVIRNTNGEWVSPCTMCTKRLQNVTNDGCTECKPRWIR